MLQLADIIGDELPNTETIYDRERERERESPSY
jgi:hypothetical protein